MQTTKEHACLATVRKCRIWNLRKSWSKQDKGQAAMITRMDRDIGKILDLLKELNIEENTLVMFTSDNGPHNEPGHNPELFTPARTTARHEKNPNGRAYGSHPCWWPKTIQSNSVSNEPFYFWDYGHCLQWQVQKSQEKR